MAWHGALDDDNNDDESGCSGLAILYEATALPSTNLVRYPGGYIRQVDRKMLTWPPWRCPTWSEHGGAPSTPRWVHRPWPCHHKGRIHGIPDYLLPLTTEVKWFQTQFNWKDCTPCYNTIVGWFITEGLLLYAVQQMQHSTAGKCHVLRSLVIGVIPDVIIMIHEYIQAHLRMNFYSTQVTNAVSWG